MKKFMLILSLLTVSSFAFAERILMPGERAYVAGDYVSCQGYGPNPVPNPIPRPTRRIQVSVRMNRSCLDAIPRTDGKDIARHAKRCDDNNLERRALRGSCALRDNLIDHALASDIIARATTVIYEDQKNVVRDAASDKIYLCEVEF